MHCARMLFKRGGQNIPLYAEWRIDFRTYITLKMNQLYYNRLCSTGQEVISSTSSWVFPPKSWLQLLKLLYSGLNSFWKCQFALPFSYLILYHCKNSWNLDNNFWELSLSMHNKNFKQVYVTSLRISWNSFRQSCKISACFNAVSCKLWHKLYRSNLGKLLQAVPGINWYSTLQLPISLITMFPVILRKSSVHLAKILCSSTSMYFLNYCF